MLICVRYLSCLTCMMRMTKRHMQSGAYIRADRQTYREEKNHTDTHTQKGAIRRGGEADKHTRIHNMYMTGNQEGIKQTNTHSEIKCIRAVRQRSSHTYTCRQAHGQAQEERQNKKAF